jgi:hypothetical protein
MTLTAAAVCPHPPLLVPEAVGGAAGSDGAAGPGGAAGPSGTELTRLRQACAAAVAALAGSDLIVIVGGGQRTTRYPSGAAGTLAGFGVPFTIGSGEPVLPLSLTIGRWLLPDEYRAELQGVAADLSPAACRDLGKQIAGLAPSVAILAMGDGPARRARLAPGAPDREADRYDEWVAAALAAASPAGLADLDPAQDGELVVAGRAAWQVLAGAAEASGTAFTGSLGYAGAPFEVSYFVASWQPGQD